MAVLADPVEDHDGVGHGVAHEDEEAGHHRHRELEAEEHEEAQGHEDVVDEGHDAAHGEAHGEAEDHVDQDGQHGQTHGGEGLAGPLAGDGGREALVLEDGQVAQAVVLLQAGLQRGGRSLGSWL